MIEARFYETYYFCNVVRNVLHDQFSYIRNLNDFHCDERIFDLVEPFQKYSLLHQFIEFVVEDIYYEEASSVELEDRRDLIENFSDKMTCQISSCSVKNVIRIIKEQAAPLLLTGISLGIFMIKYSQYAIVGINFTLLRVPKIGTKRSVRESNDRVRFVCHYYPRPFNHECSRFLD